MLDLGELRVTLTVDAADVVEPRCARQPSPFRQAHPTLIVAAHRGAAEYFAMAHDLVCGEWIGAYPGVLPTSLDSGLASFELGEVIITDRIEVEDDLWAWIRANRWTGCTHEDHD